MRIKWWSGLQLHGATVGGENCMRALPYARLGLLVSLQETFHVLLTRLQRQTALSKHMRA